jgi:hypothetical protein
VAKLKDIHRQDVMLTEMAVRIRRLLNLSPGQRHKAPLLILVGKYDIWRGLLGIDIGPAPLYFYDKGNCGLLSEMQLNSASLAIRELLKNLCPEFVATAESNWECVRYIPVSATGSSPALVNENGLLAIRPDAIIPIWTETAMAWLVARLRPDLIPTWRHQPPANAIRPVELKRAGYLLIARLPDGNTLELPLDYSGQLIRLPRFGYDVSLA